MSTTLEEENADLRRQLAEAREERDDLRRSYDRRASNWSADMQSHLAPVLAERDVFKEAAEKAEADLQAAREQLAEADVAIEKLKHADNLNYRKAEIAREQAKALAEAAVLEYRGGAAHCLICGRRKWEGGSQGLVHSEDCPVAAYNKAVQA